MSLSSEKHTYPSALQDLLWTNTMKEKIVVCTGRRVNQNRVLTTLSSVPVKGENSKYKHTGCIPVRGRREKHTGYQLGNWSQGLCQSLRQSIWDSILPRWALTHIEASPSRWMSPKWPQAKDVKLLLRWSRIRLWRAGIWSNNSNQDTKKRRNPSVISASLLTSSSRWSWALGTFII